MKPSFMGNGRPNRSFPRELVDFYIEKSLVRGVNGGIKKYILDDLGRTTSRDLFEATYCSGYSWDEIGLNKSPSVRFNPIIQRIDKVMSDYYSSSDCYSGWTVNTEPLIILYWIYCSKQAEKMGIDEKQIADLEDEELYVASFVFGLVDGKKRSFKDYVGLRYGKECKWDDRLWRIALRAKEKLVGNNEEYTDIIPLDPPTGV